MGPGLTVPSVRAPWWRCTPPPSPLPPLLTSRVGAGLQGDGDQDGPGPALLQSVFQYGFGTISAVTKTNSKAFNQGILQLRAPTAGAA